MGKYVVAISIDKVQSFLYYAIHSNTQEHQTNSGTLRSIIGASVLISDHMYECIGAGVSDPSGVFSGKVDEVLLQCSGMCVFVTSLEKNTIDQRLKELFQMYYLDFGGQLPLRYLYVEGNPKTDSDRLCMIQECKSGMKKAECLNRMLRDNKELLFQFQDQRLILESDKDKKQYPMFAETINKLDENEKDNPFRIAIIKADLDGMGALFKCIKTFDTYQKISRILTDHICLDHLSQHVERIQKEHSRFKLYPLYIAGDDIMFAVPVSQVLRGVKICEDILDDVNKKLKENQTEVKNDLAISIGVDFTYNREPIRYYYERVEEQLSIAKKDKASNKKMAINHTVIRIGKKEKNKLDYSDLYLNELERDVNLLYLAEENGFQVRNFLYGLLEKLEHPGIKDHPVKCSNIVLYHLLPKTLDSSNATMQKYELRLNYYLLNRLKDDLPTNKKQKSLSFSEEKIEKFEQYVRLLLLFFDKRFEIERKGKTPNYEIKNVDEVKKIRAAIFNRPLYYLFENSLKPKNGGEDFRSLFVNNTEYITESGQKVHVYNTVNLSPSLFHRMKNMNCDVPVCCGMIKAVNDKTKEEFEREKMERDDQKQTPPSLAFNQDEFLRLAKTGIWNKDYIDSLLIFYTLNHLLIQYRKSYRASTMTGKKDKYNSRTAKGVPKTYGKNRNKNYN